MKKTTERQGGLMCYVKDLLGRAVGASEVLGRAGSGSWMARQDLTLGGQRAPALARLSREV